MSTNLPARLTSSELREFHAFIGGQLESQANALTPGDVLELWRDQNPTLEDAAAVRDAVRQALDDMANGDTGITLEEFDQHFRAKLGLPPVRMDDLR